MSAPADAFDLHPAPRGGTVVREQLRAVGVAVRMEMLAACGLMLLSALIMLSFYVRGEGRGDFAVSDMANPAVLLGLFAPLAVWKGETPSRRGYLWSLPVARPRGTLARVLGGWGWLMALVAVYLLWAVSITWMMGGEFSVGGEWAQVMTQKHLPPQERIVEMALRPWMWAIPFGGATAMYLLGSLVVLSSEHPWRWFAGTFGVVFILGQLELLTLLWPVLAGRWGLVPLVSGMPGAERWAGAVLLWLALLLAGVVAAAWRHQER